MNKKINMIVENVIENSIADELEIKSSTICKRSVFYLFSISRSVLFCLFLSFCSYPAFFPDGSQANLQIGNTLIYSVLDCHVQHNMARYKHADATAQLNQPHIPI